MTETRVEKDLLGEKSVPAGALYGVYPVRVVENFSALARRPVRASLIHAYGAVKLACARTNRELGAFRNSEFGLRIEQQQRRGTPPDNPKSEIRDHYCPVKVFGY